jgi:CarboxypepD_reg-like domain
VKTDFNHIKNYSAEDIRRYWNNEMSSAEMNALEKAAMDDPFLADALEGYSKLQKDPIDDLAILKKRLAARSGGAAVVSIRRNNWWKVAAVFILIAGIGTMALFMFQSKQYSSIAKNESAKDSVEPPTSMAQTEKDVKQDLQSRADSSPSNIDGFSLSESRKEERLTFAKPKEGKSITVPGSTLPDRDSLSAGIASRAVSDDAYKKSEGPVAAPNAVALRKDTIAGQANRENETADQNFRQAYYFNTFSGKVVDPQNRSIPFATVRMNNANQVAAADQYGIFQFKSGDTIAEISISSVGYEERYLTMNSNQATQSIMLQRLSPSKSKMNEVVVTGKGKRSKDDPSDLKVYVMDAVPVIGWDKYNLYIDSNKKFPPNEPRLSGQVVVSFKVNPKGELSGFDVEKSLSKAYDKEAIRLIKEGPAWRVTKGKKTKAKVIIDF